jgi:hypothetical protein
LSKQLQNIHLRRIEWAISSPSLMNYPFCVNYFRDKNHEDSVNKLLAELDSNSVIVDTHFDNLRSMPMGKYFEQLLFYILDKDPRFAVLLTNHQIIEYKTTIGELDIILKDLQLNTVEHWEICLKFYLQSEPSLEQRLMLGPGAKDNMKRKIDKLIGHQMQLSKHPSISALVETENIESKLFMKGHCFYHLNNTATLPTDSNPNHEKGWWCHLSEIDTMISQDLHWCVLEKPDWIGVHQTNDDVLALSTNEIKTFLNKSISENAKPIFLAGMTKTATGWIENTRGFVVDNNWPNITLSN